jgi:N-methylhydantoinase A
MGLDSVEAAAAGIIDIVNENMLGGLRLVSVQQGFDPREFALVAFGGAGPLHANALSRLTGASPVIVPPSPGVLCALGDATTSLRDEAARTVLRRFTDLSGADLADILSELAEEAGARLADQGLPRDEQRTSYQIDVRYHGQGFEIAVDLDPSSLDESDIALARLASAFDAEHERLFSFLLNVDHELVNARATVTGPRPEVAPLILPEGDGNPGAAVVGTKPIHLSGERVDARIYDRAKLLAGDVITGPAIITEMDSTTLVLPGHAATVHRSGSLLIRPTA